jgi:hypothetical protein
MPSLAEVLFGLPTETLRHIVENQHLDTSRLRKAGTKREFVGILATDMERNRFNNVAVLACDAQMMRCMEAVVGLGLRGRMTKWQTFLDALGGSAVEQPVREAVTRLTHLGLLFPHEEGVYVPPNLENYIHVPSTQRCKLERILNDYDAETVRAILRNLNLTSARPAKAAGIEAILDFYKSPHWKESVLPLLDATETATLEHIVRAGGAVSAHELFRRFAPDDLKQVYSYNWHQRWKQEGVHTPMDRLFSLGLAGTVWGMGSFGIEVVIPGTLYHFLIEEEGHDFWLSPPREVRDWNKEGGILRTSGDTLRDVAVLLAFIHTQDVVETNAGTMHRTALKNVMRQFQKQEEDYAVYLFYLCRMANLIATREDKPNLYLTQRGLSWLTWEPNSQKGYFFQIWRHINESNDAKQYPLQIKQRSGSEEGGTPLSLILGLIAKNDGGSFTDISSIADIFHFEMPLLTTLPLQADDGGTIETIISSLVGSLMFLLGMTEIMFYAEAGQEHDIVAYRLTPLGKSTLANAPLPADDMPQESQFILQPNGEVIIPPYLPISTLYRLRTLSDIPKQGSWQTPPVISKDSIRRALDKGDSIESIRDFLQQYSKVGIPQTLAYLFQEVGNRHGHIQIGKASLYVQVDSPLLLQELKARKETKALIGRTLSDTIALVRGEDVDKVLKELRKLGYLPIEASDSGVSHVGGDFVPDAPPSPTPPEPPRKQRSESKVAWEDFAKEDGESWRLPRETDGIVPAGAETNQNHIRFLCQQAIQRKIALEIGAESQETGERSTYQIQPFQKTNEVLGGKDITTGETHLLYFPEILWVRFLS